MGIYWDKQAGHTKNNLEKGLPMDLAQWAGLEDLEEDKDKIEEDQNFEVKFDMDLQLNLDKSWEQFQIFNKNGSLATFRHFITQDMDSDDKKMSEEEEEALTNNIHEIEEQSSMQPTSTIT